MRLSNITPSFYKAIILTTFLALIMADSAFGQDQTVTLTTTGQGENLQQATDNALRSAIEQTFGAFISTRTEILNDDLVSDQIASVTGGNIQSYEVLAQTELSETLWGVTVSAVVSVTKLTSFVQARGVQVEIQGGLFAANIRQQVLNEEAEIEAVRNMVGVLHELFQTAFDYEIQNGTPVATDATSSNWKIPLTITATANKNMELVSQYLRSTLLALSLVPEEVTLYKELNKDVYTADLSGSSSIALRRVQSFEMLEKLVGNLPEIYPRLYAVDSGLDRKIGQGVHLVEPAGRTRRHAQDQHLLITLLAASRQAATFSYDDQRTLDEINKLTGYSVEPLGVTLRVMVGDVYNPVTKKTWMDRNLGALWVPLTATDGGGYGSYYTIEEAQTACPAGYRLPTEAEWTAERQSWSSNNASGAINSTLKLPLAGYRDDSNGSLLGVGSSGHYWSSSVGGSNGLGFDSTNAYVGGYNRRAYGRSVRCLKD